MNIENATPCAAMPTVFDTDAACDSAQAKMLRTICYGCPVQAACYLVATTTPVKDLGGFMAGLTEGQRRGIITRRKAVA